MGVLISTLNVCYTKGDILIEDLYHAAVQMTDRQWVTRSDHDMGPIITYCRDDRHTLNWTEISQWLGVLLGSPAENRDCIKTLLLHSLDPASSCQQSQSSNLWHQYLCSIIEIESYEILHSISPASSFSLCKMFTSFQHSDFIGTKSQLRPQV